MNQKIFPKSHKGLAVHNIAVLIQYSNKKMKKKRNLSNKISVDNLSRIKVKIIVTNNSLMRKIALINNPKLAFRIKKILISNKHTNLY